MAVTVSPATVSMPPPRDSAEQDPDEQDDDYGDGFQKYRQVAEDDPRAQRERDQRARE